MNCGSFLLLLESLETQDTASLGPEALAHAEGCALCGRALAEARALERALTSHCAAGEEPAPAGFTDRLMARVERMPQVRLAPADVARATLAAFATPPIAASLAAAAALLGFAAANGFDPGRIGAAAGIALAPFARVLDALAHPLPATGLAREIAGAGLVVGVFPLAALLIACAWWLGTLIGEKSPRAL